MIDLGPPPLIMPKPAIIRPAQDLIVPRHRPGIQLAGLPGFGALAGFLEQGDEYWSNVVSLIQPSGADGSTSFTDLSIAGGTITPTGDAQVDTGITHFGNPTVLFDGGGDSLQVSNIDLDTFLGTLEGWFYFSSVSNGEILSNDNGGYDVAIRLAGGDVFVHYGNNTTASLTTVTTATWYYIALVIEASDVRLYVNGPRVYTRGSGITGANGTTYLQLGGVSGNYMAGNLGEFRATQGVSRYTGASMTVPTEPFKAF